MNTIIISREELLSAIASEYGTYDICDTDPEYFLDCIEDSFQEALDEERIEYSFMDRMQEYSAKEEGKKDEIGRRSSLQDALEHLASSLSPCRQPRVRLVAGHPCLWL